jgi:hypothetical protein
MIDSKEIPIYLLDTAVIMDYFTGITQAKAYIETIQQNHAVAYFSVITEAELWTGLRSEEELLFQEAVLSYMHRIPVDREIARMSGDLKKRYGRKGLSLNDALKAATAILNELTLVTPNQKYFKLLEEEGLLKCSFYKKVDY